MRYTIVLGLIVVVFSMVFSLALAKETSPLAPSPTPTPLEYALPYPGLLPDHPLYFIKQTRDFILMKLISSPIRKVEFYILNADKELNMSIFLQNNEKYTLATQTAKDSLEHLKQANTQLFQIPQTTEVNNMKDRLEKSLQKHLEIFTDQSQHVDEENKTKYEQLLQETRGLIEEFSRMK